MVASLVAALQEVVQQAVEVVALISQQPLTLRLAANKVQSLALALVRVLGQVLALDQVLMRRAHQAPINQAFKLNLMAGQACQDFLEKSKDQEREMVNQASQASQVKAKKRVMAGQDFQDTQVSVAYLA